MVRLNLIFFAQLTFLILFSQNSFSQQNIGGWYWINNQPQGNNINWVQIIDNDLYYAAGNNGIFMKSSDGGDSWLINATAGQPLLNIYCGNFFDANTGVLSGESGTDDGGRVRRTTDGGLTFLAIDLDGTSGYPFNAFVNDMYFINSTTGYLCGNRSVKAFKTTDAGLNWIMLPNLNDSYSFNCIYAGDENNIIMGLKSDNTLRKIIRTTNAGITWFDQTLPGTSTIDFTDIKFLNADTGFISGNNYFGYTIDGGVNWSQSILPNNSNNNFQKLIISGNEVNVLGTYSPYYTTTNFGLVWDSVNYSDNNNPNQPFGISNAFDITGSEIVVAGERGQINISSDSGFNWQNKNYAVGNAKYPFKSIYSLSGTEKVWAGASVGSNNGLIYFSSDRGANWYLPDSSYLNRINDIQMINSNTGYSVGGFALEIFFLYVGICNKTTNGGINWVPLNSTFPNVLHTVDFINADTGWCLGNFQEIYKTTDGGSYWFPQETTPPSQVGYIDMFDENNGYCVNFANVWKTTNGGDNWNMLNNLPYNFSWKKLKTFSGDDVYVAGNQRIYKSSDGGVSWDSIITPSDLNDMDWTDPNNGIIVNGGFTAKTSNGGATWTERYTGSGVNSVLMASKDTVFVAAGEGILRLYDDTPSLTVINITVGIEGFWNGSIQVSDTVKCHLRNSVSPFEEVEVISAVSDYSGLGIYQFTTASSGSYYLDITQRNSIETWSALPVTVSSGGINNYDFTTSPSNAFGNNVILRSGRYCNYSGDVNQDGFVNLTDLILTSTEAFNFNAGYIQADVNGDDIADMNDVAIVYNNSEIFISKITP